MPLNHFLDALRQGLGLPSVDDVRRRGMQILPQPLEPGQAESAAQGLRDAAPDAAEFLSNDPINSIFKMLAEHIMSDPSGSAGYGLGAALGAGMPGVPAKWARPGVRKLLGELRLPETQAMGVDDLTRMTSEPGVLGAMDAPVVAQPNVVSRAHPAEPVVTPQHIDWNKRELQGPPTYQQYMEETAFSPEKPFPVPIGGVGPSGYTSGAEMLAETGKVLKTERPGMTWWQHPKTPSDRVPNNFGAPSKPGPLPILRKGRPSSEALQDVGDLELLGSAQPGTTPGSGRLSQNPTSMPKRWGGMIPQTDAQRALIETHYESAYRVALKVTKSPDLAQEAAQDVITSVMQNIDKIDRNPRGLIVRLAGQRAIDVMRKQGAAFGRPMKSVEEIMERMESPNPTNMPESMITKQDFLRDMNVKAIRDAIEGPKSALSADQKELADLLWNEGLEPEEAAERLGITYGALRNRLSRMRPALRKTVAAHIGLPTQEITKYRLPAGSNTPRITKSGGTVPQGGVSIPREVKRKPPLRLTRTPGQGFKIVRKPPQL